MQDAPVVLIDAVVGLPSLAEDGVQADSEACTRYSCQVWPRRSDLLRHTMRSVFKPEHYDDFGHRAYARSCSWFGELVTTAFENKDPAHVMHRWAEAGLFLSWVSLDHS